MKVIEIIKDAAQRATIDIDSTLSGNESAKVHFLRAFNLVYKYFNLRYNWPWREKTITLQTIPNYISGSVTVLNGSRSVNGSNVTWTSSMVGRYLKVTRDNEIYQIKAVPNSTQLILTDPYIGTSSSNLSYLIWKKFYDLPPDVPFAKGIFFWQWPKRNEPIPFKDMSNQFSMAYLTGFPYAWSWYGTNNTVLTYQTGSILVTVDSKTLTGTNTSFLGNVFEGSRITIGTSVYNIDTVDSDTQITMCQNATTSADTTDGTIWKVESTRRSQVCFSSVPDPAINLYVTYPCRTYELVNDNDEPLIWDGFEIALTNILYAYILEKLTSNRSFSWLTLAEAQTKEVFRNINENNPIDRALVPMGNFPEGYRAGLYS